MYFLAPSADGLNSIDDIEDNSQLRRGKPGMSCNYINLASARLIPNILVAHKIFGIAQAINCGNYVYFLAVQQASALKPFQQEGSDVVDIVLCKELPAIPCRYLVLTSIHDS